MPCPKPWPLRVTEGPYPRDTGPGAAWTTGATAAVRVTDAAKMSAAAARYWDRWVRMGRPTVVVAMPRIVAWCWIRVGLLGDPTDPRSRHGPQPASRRHDARRS